ncbi:MAG: cation transporter, partial [Pseudomonadales bacterium]|nr:cation transporter [Pseudomonadales bacterium]
MSNHCCSALPPAQDKRFKRVLWFALWVNGLMFCIELFAGFQANSASLLADAVDFFSDTVNYAISLAVVGSSLLARSSAALFKGITMALYGFGILGKVAYSAWVGHTPEAMTMGTIGLLALIANVVVAYFLFRYREGDANQRSIWLCSRNDAIGNIAVIAAALSV